MEVITLDRESKSLVRKEYEGKLNLASLTKLHWIRISNPDSSEIKAMGEILELDAEDIEEVEDFIKEGSRPRVIKESYLQVIYSVPFKENGDIITEPIMMFALRNLIITIERNVLPVCEDILKVRKKNKKNYMFRQGSIFFMSEILDQINDEFLFNVNNIDNRTDIIKSKDIELNRKQIDTIFAASTTLAFFNSATMANLEVLSALKKLQHKLLRKEDRDTFNDIYFDALQILDNGKILSEVIMNIFNMQSIINSQQINNFMKKLTALALIIMVPTLISGIYGMNVALPFMHETYAFYLVVGLTAALTLTIYLSFKKMDWV